MAFSVRLGFFIFSFFVIAACQKDKSHPVGASTTPDLPKTVSTRATRLADEFRITCELGACPQGTGVLVFSSALNSGICTAWVAGEIDGKSVVMTNRHCVEKVTDCGEDLAFKFPESNESARCGKILKTSEFSLEDEKGKSKLVPDYSIVLLDRKLKVKPLPISQDGLVPNSEISIRKVWVDGYRSLVLRETKCETGTANILLPEYKSADSSNYSLHQCEVKGGVSGSPVLNSRGEVTAIVQIGPKSALTLSLPSLAGLVSDEFKITDVGFATSLGCVEFSGLNLRKKGACAPENGDSVDSSLKEVFNEKKMLKGIIGDYLEFINRENGGIFGWTTRPDEGRRVTFITGIKGLYTIEMVPKCILRPDDSDSRLKRDFYSEGYLSLFGGWAKTGQAELDAPGWSVHIKVNKYGQLGPGVVAGKKFATYKFSPKELAELKDGETATVEEWVGLKTTYLKLPLCKKGFLTEDRSDSRALHEAFISQNDAEIDRTIKELKDKAKQ